MIQPFLSVIVPAHNEAERLPLTLLDIDRYLNEAEYASEILVVNDGSTDKTAEIVRRMSGAVKNLKLVENETNAGKGAAVKKGMLLTRGKIRLFTDADGSISIDHFERILPYFKEGCEVVIASRALKESRLNHPQSLPRRFAERIENLVIRALVTPGIRDTQCGFKAFSEDAAERIFSVIKASGWAFDVEALALAQKFGYRMKEVPIAWAERESAVRRRHRLQTLLETFRIRWWLTTFEKSYKPRNHESHG